MTFFSTTITPTTNAQQLMTNKPGIERVLQAQIYIRSIGTATYVGVGGRDSQDRRLTVAGANISIDIPMGMRYVDLRSLFVSSDTSDAVVEVLGDSYGVF